MWRRQAAATVGGVCVCACTGVHGIMAWARRADEYVPLVVCPNVFWG